MSRWDLSPHRIRFDSYSFSALDTPPSDLEACVLSLVSSLLERLVIRNENHPALVCQHLSFNKLAAFSAIQPPTISIPQYLERIFKYANCSPSCFVVAYVYIDRMMQIQPQFRITSLNVHRLLITSVMVAAKLLDDICHDNAYYAKIGGITSREMNKLELHFLFLLDFRLHVTVSVFESYCCHLEREVALGGGYQIERTLRTICDGGCGGDESTTEEPMVLIVKCSGLS